MSKGSEVSVGGEGAEKKGGREGARDGRMERKGRGKKERKREGEGKGRSSTSSLGWEGL